MRQKRNKKSGTSSVILPNRGVRDALGNAGSDPVVLRRRIIRRRILLCFFLLLMIKPALMFLQRGSLSNPVELLTQLPKDGEQCFQIAGPSMEPAYPGPTLTFTCPRCEQKSEYSFAWPSEQTPDLAQISAGRRFVTCTTCGNTEVPYSTGVASVGATVTRTTKPAPQRWQTILFTDAQGNSTVKRIVGLPGETVQLMGGDLYVNNEIVVKSRPLYDELAVPVPVDTVRGEDRTLLTAWQSVPVLSESPESETRHEPHVVTNEPVRPLLDYIGKKEPESVRDFILTLEQKPGTQCVPSFDILVQQEQQIGLVRVDRTATQVTVALYDTNENIATFNPESASRVWSQNIKYKYGNDASKPLQDEIAEHSSTFSLYWCDGIVLICIDQMQLPLVTLPERSKMFSAGITTPFALKTDNVTNREDCFTAKVFRDVHYNNASDSTDAPVFTVPPQTCFLLGDNSLISSDSRHWDPPCVPFDKIIGPVTSVEQTGSSRKK
ncbi:MAG: S26 family signal peptidase [Planctomycetia bacterium]|nr:S26 family signal peptidase [Planctomycetia bacterium]